MSSKRKTTGEDAQAQRRKLLLAAGSGAAGLISGLMPGAEFFSRQAHAAGPATGSATGSATASATASATPGGPSASQPSGAAASHRYPIIVLNSRDADITLIDPLTHAPITRVPTGKEPHHLYPTPDNRHVLVANAVSDSLTMIDPRDGRIEQAIPGIEDPYHLGFSPDQSAFVTCANRLDRIDVYRATEKAGKLEFRTERRFNLPKTPSHLVFSEDSKTVFCTLQDSDEVVAIDLRGMKVLWKVKVGRLPAGIAISPDSKLIFIGIMGEDYVQVIDRLSDSSGPRLTERIKTGAGAHAFRNQGNRRHLWVSNRTANTISRIDMSTFRIESRIEVSGGPDCMDLSASGKQLWVTQRWARSVALIDLDQSRVVKRVTVGRSPHGVYLHDRAPIL